MDCSEDAIDLLSLIDLNLVFCIFRVITQKIETVCPLLKRKYTYANCYRYK